jgi:hypothetical protein
MGDLIQTDDPDHPGQTRMVARLKAATCDLCITEDEDLSTPRCVYACPHDAAHRTDGTTLLRAVRALRLEPWLTFEEVTKADTGHA